MSVNMCFYVQPTYSHYHLYDIEYFDRIHIKSKINITFPVNYYIYCYILDFLDINKQYITVNFLRLQTIAVVSCMLVSLVSCQQYQQTTPIPIVRYENDGVNFDGSYKWA